MPAARMTADQLQETIDLVAKHGTVTKAAIAIGTPRTTLQARYNQARLGVLTTERPHYGASVGPESISYAPEPALRKSNRPGPFASTPIPDDVPPRRHVFIPDTQIRPGVPTDHIAWIGEDIARRKPDVIVVGGDWWDFPSLNSHAQPGSAPLENTRYQADLDAGNIAFARFSSHIDKELEKIPAWHPRKIFIAGNHEDRADRAAITDPKWLGHVGSNNCQVRDFEWHPFLRRVVIDGIVYAHYFQNSHSKFPIGGTVHNRLGRIGASFCQGHVQGFDYGTRITGAGATWHGIVAGSCYLHQEDYRGAQGQRHWRGIIYLNEVRDGDYCVMPLTLDYLCRKATGQSLYRYMRTTYPDGDWEHLR